MCIKNKSATISHVGNRRGTAYRKADIEIQKEQKNSPEWNKKQSGVRAQKRIPHHKRNEIEIGMM